MPCTHPLLPLAELSAADKVDAVVRHDGVYDEQLERLLSVGGV